MTCRDNADNRPGCTKEQCATLVYYERLTRKETILEWQQTYFKLCLGSIYKAVKLRNFTWIVGLGDALLRPVKLDLQHSNETVCDDLLSAIRAFVMALPPRQARGIDIDEGDRVPAKHLARSNPCTVQQQSRSLGSMTLSTHVDFYAHLHMWGWGLEGMQMADWLCGIALSHRLPHHRGCHLVERGSQ